MKKLNNNKFTSPRLAYAGFLFQTFFRRPFGYIIACLYVVYLAVILLIVPKILKAGPLFIWTVGGFNMPVFNLFFIAASAAALAVSIFRTGREDGTELCLSSKPLTKGSMIAMKVVVYLIIMAVFAALGNIITGLTQPLFGWYNDITNIRGITPAQFTGLNLSVLVGNLINMLLFGAIAVLITTVGGQVITMVGTIGLVFVMCLMNFIYPQVVTSSLEVLKNKYDAEILTYSANTLDQYINSDKSGPKQFATIACSTDAEGIEKNHFDTNEYWLKAERESGGMATNYIDIARQLSSLYNAFGLDESKLKEASKLSIGMNRGFRYHIDPESHISTKENQNASKYPIAFYSMTTSQGFEYPLVLTLSGDMTIDKQNWYALSLLNQYDFAACSILTNGSNSILMSSDEIREEYQRTYFKINELSIDKSVKKVTDNLYDMMLAEIASHPQWTSEEMSSAALVIIASYGEEPLFEGNYADLTADQKHAVISKVHMAWAVRAQQEQISAIETYVGLLDSFPFKSLSVKKWYKDNVVPDTGAYKTQQKFGEFIYNGTIKLRLQDFPDKGVQAHDKLVVSKINYAETYSNMYEYHVSNFYSIKTIVIVWSLVSVIFFAGSIIVYKKIDLK